MRGRDHLKEYYKDEMATASIYDSHGWFSLGDLGRVDEEGYFYFSGKKSDLINKGGEKIAPSEIELALQQHPFVLEAACTGRKDENEEIKILACVVARPDCKLTEGDLLQFCEKTIGPYKTPDRIAFVLELPRSPSGKLLRGKLPVI